MTTSSVPKISVAFATTLDTPEHVEPAEQLGFARAWVYDTDHTPGCWPARGLAAKLSSAGRSVVVHVSAKMFGEPFRGRLTRLVEVGSRAPRVNGVVVAVDFEQTLGLPGSLERGAGHLG
jgi:hypothetical protein